jgi:hypothetical protein
MRKRDNSDLLVDGCAGLVLIYLIACMIVALIGCNYQRELTKTFNEKKDVSVVDSTNVSKTNTSNSEDWERIIERFNTPVTVAGDTNITINHIHPVERIIERGSRQQQASTFDSGTINRIKALEEKTETKESESKVQVLTFWHLIAVAVISVLVSLILGRLKISWR